MPYDWGSPATAGLWQVVASGPPAPAAGRDAQAAGPVSYTYFVKLLRHPRRWPGLAYLPDQASRDEFAGFFPWRFELDMYQCGIGDVLPAGMRTPRLHHVKTTDGDHLGLWWEFVPERPAPWELADYRRAAFLLGRLAARRRHAADVNRLLPQVCTQAHPAGSSLRFFTDRRILRGVLPALRAGQIWRHPLASAALRSLLPVGFDLGQLLVGLAHAGPQPHPRPRARPEAAGRPGRFETAGVSDFALGKLAEHSATGSVRLARVILVQAIRMRWPVTSRCGRSRTWLPRRLPIE